jgi:hypothetical protein
MVVGITDAVEISLVDPVVSDNAWLRQPFRRRKWAESLVDSLRCKDNMT